ncbi:MAG: hypothetical protein V5A45_07240 [Haloarculaceae archaeon]
MSGASRYATRNCERRGATLREQSGGKTARRTVSANKRVRAPEVVA